MHILQKRILALAKQQDLDQIGYRKIGSLIGESHPQKVKWHLEKLIRDGHLLEEYDGSIRINSPKRSSTLMTLPVLGRANCGEPLELAQENWDETVQVSKSLLPRGRLSKCFAVRAVGESMNRASIDGQTIQSGDLVIIDSSQTAPRDGDYVVASVDGAATIKKFRFDKQRNRVVLNAESTISFNPIVLSTEDEAGLVVHGKVIDVIPTAS